MTSLQSKVPINMTQQRSNAFSNSMTREDIMMLAQNEYARQLRKFTEAQLKQKVPRYVEQRKLGMKTISSLKTLH
ncbi:MAG: hypothetical protein EXX96DRAFT_582240 [Benjaminiella poitrasii]|nr:MAG: hypothetical protein EXX96DRAFT_582240 [Benjaminiella poitrasii]